MARDLGLVLDLSFAGFACAADGSGLSLARRWRPPGARHDDLDTWIEDALREAGAGYPDLDWICVGVGPGSFTGIRIAMAFAQGLAMPRRLPVHGFTSFAPLLLPPSAAADKPRVAAIPANAGRFYAAETADASGSILTAAELARRGRDAELAIPADHPAFDPVRAAFPRVHSVEGRWDVAAVAGHARAADFGALKPLYLQPSAAEAKAGGTP